MQKLDYYIIKKFLGTFFFAISLLIIIVIIFDISENIDEFIEKGAPLKAVIFDYYLNFIPYFVNLFSYLFTFISVIYFTSKLAGNTEIVAMLSAGISYNRILRPYFISAILLAIMSFYLANFLIPHTNQKRRVFKNKYIEDLMKDKDRDMHMQISPGTYVYVEYFHMNNLTGYKFSLEQFKNEELVYKLMADRIVWDTVENHWRIQNYYARTINGTEETLNKGTVMDTVLNLYPQDLYYQKERFEEMNLMELNSYIKKQKLKGSEEVVFYEVEKYSRISSPFATLVLTLIGVSLSSRKIRGGIGMHLGLGILITFAYILFSRVSNVFATFGNLEPAFAVWIPNIIFTALGILLLRTAPK
jgi:lipopolysaccharide export system permease protein